MVHTLKVKNYYDFYKRFLYGFRCWGRNPKSCELNICILQPLLGIGIRLIVALEL